MPKLWDATIESHRASVRQAILDAVRTLVAERGLRAISMADIAARAGIGRATLYRYFDDAEAVLRAWHDREVGHHRAELGALKDGPGDPGERLVAVLERYAGIAARRGGHDPELAAVLHHDERFTRAQRSLRRLLAELIAEAANAGAVRDDVAPSELAAYCLHALAAAGNVSSKAAVQRLVTVTFDGLRRPPGTGQPS